MSVEVLTTISPTTNEPILTRNGLSATELELLPQVATQAFQSWRTTRLEDRKSIVRKALKLLAERQDELAMELTVQMGRPITFAAKEVGTAIKRAEYLLKISDEALKDTCGEAEPGFKRFIRKVPVGPVLVIFAWNYPYLILVNSLIPALLSGNSVILKPSPQTPTVVEQVARVFSEAGLPDGVIQYFHCGSPTMIESIDAAYVRSDVDVAWAAEEIVDGAVFNSGQSCCSIERVYVDEKIHEEFVSAVQEVLKGYKLGDPLDRATHVGPVVSKRSQATIESHIQDALRKGAKDATPENVTFSDPPTKGNFVPPTLLVDVDHTMTVMTEETFGPVIPVMRVKSDEEAVKLMNDCEFGLTASIWTKDTARGRELSEHVESGTVFVNRCDYPSPDLAWTGWKNSGKGVTLSRFGFDQFVKLKSYHLKDYPHFSGKPLGIPAPSALIHQLRIISARNGTEMVGHRKSKQPKRVLEISAPFNFKKETGMLPGISEQELSLLREKELVGRIGVADHMEDHLTPRQAPPVPMRSSATNTRFAAEETNTLVSPTTPASPSFTLNSKLNKGRSYAVSPVSPYGIRSLREDALPAQI
ncbi:hypothetical protein P8C59_006164 [Phyllachora maydis]|uniref:aldehyde dehydrogenase (NAD(+)) n=1 Tax=Phyllachora maydis TaxID=1825666 RepID=A0AAD9I5W7_9PEZI|nr:hypothetical protein P8C59_006164 [Phyllachora maydis]